MYFTGQKKLRGQKMKRPSGRTGTQDVGTGWQQGTLRDSFHLRHTAGAGSTSRSAHTLRPVHNESTPQAPCTELGLSLRSEVPYRSLVCPKKCCQTCWAAMAGHTTIPGCVRTRSLPTSEAQSDLKKHTWTELYILSFHLGLLKTS